MLTSHDVSQKDANLDFVVLCQSMFAYKASNSAGDIGIVSPCLNWNFLFDNQTLLAGPGTLQST